MEFLAAEEEKDRDVYLDAIEADLSANIVKWKEMSEESLACL